MRLSDILAKDLSAILADFEQPITIIHAGARATVSAAVDVANISDAGYLAVEGEAVQCTATVQKKALPFTVGIGDTVELDGYRYRVTTLTSTLNDPAVVLSLEVEGKNA